MAETSFGATRLRLIDLILDVIDLRWVNASSAWLSELQLNWSEKRKRREDVSSPTTAVQKVSVLVATELLASSILHERVNVTLWFWPPLRAEHPSCAQSRDGIIQRTQSWVLRRTREWDGTRASGDGPPWCRLIRNEMFHSSAPIISDSLGSTSVGPVADVQLLIGGKSGDRSTQWPV